MTTENSFQDEYLNSPNPKKPSTTRREAYNSINRLDSTPVRPDAMWPHNCSLATLEDWDARLSERPEGSRFTDPSGYIRGDDYIYTLEKNKINWTAARIEHLRFENAVNYLHYIEEKAKGKADSQIDKQHRDAVHPNRFGFAMNYQATIQKRSDWKGELRPRFAKIIAQKLLIYETSESTAPKIEIPLVGCEIKGYDAQAANTNPACDLYGMGFTDDQAKRVVCIRPSPMCPKSIPIYIVLPTYEERIAWLYAMKRKAEDRITVKSEIDMTALRTNNTSITKSIKGMLYNAIKGKK
jgi:hypothetical protein